MNASRLTDIVTRGALLLFCCITAGIHPTVAAADLGKAVTFDIAAQNLPSALLQFAAQSGVQVTSPGQLIEGKVSAGVVGMFAAREALERLLRDTNLRFDIVDENTVLIVAPVAHQSSAGAALDKQTAARERAGGMRLAQTSRTDGSGSAGATQDTGQKSGEETKGAASAGRINEIIVTAQKREERLQDVPISIAVVSADDIDRRGLVNAADYLRGIPGVNQVDNAFGQTIVIRGIESSPQYQNFGSGATVATYFGETPTTSAAGYDGTNVDIKLVDIERVEVLRGPQGTTFGSSALGGSVRTIPAAPRLDGYEAKVGVNYSMTSGTGGGNNMVQATGNIPIVPGRFAVRAVAYRGEDTGFYRNVSGSDAVLAASAAAAGALGLAADKDHIGDSYFAGGRISALMQASENLKFTVGYLKQKTELDGLPFANRPGYDQAVLQVGANSTRRGQKYGLADHDLDIAHATIDYTFGWANLLATYSYIKSAFLEAPPGSISTFAPFPRSQLVDGDQRGDIGELRLTTQLDGAWNFLAGLYAEETEDAGTYRSFWEGNPAANNYFPGLGGLEGVYLDQRKLKQKAAFGEASWTFLPGLTLTGGVRAYKYTRDGRVDADGAFYGAGGIHSVRTAEASGTSLRGNLSYKPNESALLYATWSQGFRLGKPQEGAPAGICDPDGDGIINGTNISIASTRELRSDGVDNMELGGRFQLFDRRLSIDAGVFRMDWTGIPVFYYLPRPPQACGYGFNVNAGKAVSDGVELQLTWQVSSALRVDAGGSWIDAKLTEDVPAIGATVDDRLPGSPKVNANVGVQYEFDVAGHAAWVRADSIYVGTFYGDLLQSSFSKAGDYVKLDASARVSISKVDIGLYVRNLTNADDFAWRGAYNWGPDVGYHLQPRTIGLQLNMTF